MLSWLFNYPTDVIKTKFQADDTFKSYWEAIAHTYRTQGYRGFLNGLNSTLLRLVISEYISKIVDEKEKIISEHYFTTLFLWRTLTSK